MTSQGHNYHVFKRALDRRDLSTAWAVAVDLPTVGLEDALALTLLVRAAWPVRYPRAAAKWVGRYAVETDAPIAEVMLVASHLAALEGSADAQAVGQLTALLEALGRNSLAQVARGATS